MLLSALLPLPAAGCCNLAMLWCGPDTSQWVSESYDSPEAAVRTFMEAVRRDNPRVICEALSPQYKAQLGIPGCFEAAVAWKRIADQTPGAHLLGTAEVSAPTALSDGRVGYQLEVAGYRIEVLARRIGRIGIRYRFEGADDEYAEDFVPSLTPFIGLDREDLDPRAKLEFDIPGGLELLPDAVSARDITQVIATYEWRIDSVWQLTDDES